MKISEAGSWKVHAGTAVTSDGAAEWHTSADPAELLVALLAHLGVASVGTEAEVAAAESRGRSAGYAEAVAKLRDDEAWESAQRAQVDQWHEDICACDAWPADCVTYRRTVWTAGRGHAPTSWHPANVASSLADFLEASTPTTEEPHHA